MTTVINYTLGVIIVVLGLALSIGLHEIGHLVPAKLFGVKVTEYMIGFGPRLWSKRRGETTYGVKAIPLGGYIAMVGMYPPDPKFDADAKRSGFFRKLIQDAREQSAEGIDPGDEGRTFYSKPVWQRLIVMFGGPFMNLVLAVVLFAIVLMGFGIAKPSTQIQAVTQCVVAAGSTQTECASTDPLSPAALAGFEAGDTLVSVNGAPVEQWTDFTSVVAASPGEELTVEITRNGEPVTLTVTPALNQRYATDANGQFITENGERVIESVGYAGLSPASEIVHQTPADVFATVGTTITQTGAMILQLPQKLVGIVQSTAAGTERDPNGPISVVGIGAVAGEVFSLEGASFEGRIATLLGLLASLNVALFVFNLIPLLPLDGGHMVAAIWEATRRRFAKWFKRPDPGPVDAAKLMPLTFVVFVAILGMSTLLIWADIVNPVSLFG